MPNPIQDPWIVISLGMPENHGQFPYSFGRTPIKVQSWSGGTVRFCPRSDDFFPGFGKRREREKKVSVCAACRLPVQ